MKKIKEIGLMMTVLLSIISGCTKAQRTSAEHQAGTNSQADLTGKKVLIVYLSRTNNTKAIAQMIHQQVGGKLVALELTTPYPQNYQAIVAQVARENETDYLPPLKTRIDSLSTYDLIFLGFPTWGMQLPPPMKSFLKQNDLRGKTIIPFNSNAGYGIGSTFQTVKELAPNSTILEGFTTKGGIERDGVLFVMEGDKEKQTSAEVKIWLQKLKLIK